MFHSIPPNTLRNLPLPSLPQPPPNYKPIEYTFLIIHPILLLLLFIISSSSFQPRTNAPYEQHRTLSQSSPPFTNPNYTYSPLSYDAKSKFLLPMLNDYFSGSWQSPSPPLHFNNNNGTIYIKYRTYKRFKGRTHFTYNYDIYIFDGAYNNRSLFLTHTPIHLTSTYPIIYAFTALNNTSSFHLIETKLLFNVNELKYLRYVSSNTMTHVNLLMQLPHNNNNSYTNITGNIAINDMSFTFNIKNNTSFIEHNMFVFSSNLIIIGVLLLCVYHPLYKKLEMSSQLAMNYSPYLFFVSCMFNCGIGFECFMGALIDERMSNYFTLPCALYLVIACYCESKIIITIMKHQTNREHSDNYIRLITLRKKIIYFFVWFYIVLILFMFYSCDIFFWKSVNYVFSVLSFLPQIIANVTPYQKEMISIPLLCVIVMNHVNFVCEFRLGENFLLFEPDVKFCVVNGAIIVGEVVVLVVLRYVRVVRTVVARVGRKKKEFDYFKSIKQVMKMQGGEVVSKVCPVCLGGFLKDEHNVTIEMQSEGSLPGEKKVDDVKLKVNENSNDNDSSKDNTRCISKCKCNCMCMCCCCLFKKRNPFNEIVMLTPCGHVFHVDCLQQWMKLKNTCPECRGELPNYT